MQWMITGVMESMFKWMMEWWTEWVIESLDRWLDKIFNWIFNYSIKCQDLGGMCRWCGLGLGTQLLTKGYVIKIAGEEEEEE